MVVADKTEPPRHRPRRVGFLRPRSHHGALGAGDLRQDGEHVRVRVLRLVEDHAVAPRPQPREHDRVFHQPPAPEHLVAVRHQSLAQPVVAERPRDPHRQGARGFIEPARVGLDGGGHGGKEGPAAGGILGQFEERRAAVEIGNPRHKVALVLACLLLRTPAVVVQRGGKVQRRRFVGRLKHARGLRYLRPECAREGEELLEAQVPTDAGEQVWRQGERVDHPALAEAFPERVLVAFF